MRTITETIITVVVFAASLTLLSGCSVRIAGMDVGIPSTPLINNMGVGLSIAEVDTRCTEGIKVFGVSAGQGFSHGVCQGEPNVAPPAASRTHCDACAASRRR